MCVLHGNAEIVNGYTPVEVAGVLALNEVIVTKFVPSVEPVTGNPVSFVELSVNDPVIEDDVEELNTPPDGAFGAAAVPVVNDHTGLTAVAPPFTETACQ